MTGKAFRVIESRVALQLVVRVMTGNTTDPRIALVSPAIKNSVGLKTDVVEAALSWHDHYLVEAVVAGAAEFLRQFVRIHASWIKDLQVFKLSSPGSRNVFFARTMTGFTGYPWD